MFGRFLSLCIAGLYLWSAATGGQHTILRVLIFLVLPLGCIWYGDELGGYTGRWGSEYIDTPTPGFLVQLGGWMLLCGPLLVAVLRH
jgi:hypothetical protein